MADRSLKQGRRAVALVGPTASGKTGLAIRLAEALETEIINVDSRQIYRRLDIGTAKPTAAQLKRVPHHLIDIVDPDETFSAGRFRERVEETLPLFEKKGHIPLFVGGTGLYLKAVFEGLCSAPPADDHLRRWLREAARFPAGGLHALLERVDPSAARKIHPNDAYRLTRALEVYYLTGERLSSRQKRHRFGERPFRHIILGLKRESAELKSRIARRLEEMITAGFVEEVSALLDEGLDPALPSLRAVGYPQMIAHLRGETSLDETMDMIRKATWQYSRRQMTWFRAVTEIVWLDDADEETLAEEARMLIST